MIWPMISLSSVQSAPPPPCAAAAAAAASLQCFLVSAALVLSWAPALAEPLGPDPLRLGDRHHPGAAPAVAPHPDIHLVELAAVAPVPQRVGGGVSNTPIVLGAVWDSGLTVTADEARSEGGAIRSRNTKLEGRLRSNIRIRSPVTCFPFMIYMISYIISYMTYLISYIILYMI